MRPLPLCRPLPLTHPCTHLFPTLLVLLPLLLFTTLPLSCLAQTDPRRRDFRPLSSPSIRQITSLPPAEWPSVSSGHLEKLLIPRPVGSENSTLVQRYISSVFDRLGWTESAESFTASTPIGDRTFTNLVYTFDPEAPRKLVIAAHYDSITYATFPQNQFIGATDSAAPCAMMLDLAEALTPLLSARQERVQAGGARWGSDGYDEDDAAETTLQLVFFDGEEAFHSWTDTDSVYGARHLAGLWDNSYLPTSHPLVARRMGQSATVIETIDHLVLLDLLGNSQSRIHSYFRETDWLHDEMASADQRLREEGLVEVEAGEEGWFTSERLYKGMIGDDHVPFMQRGVSVLHVISYPFPRVWHTLADDASALSLPALRRWNRILRVFTSEYLGLQPEALPNKRTTDELHDIR